MQSSHYPTSNLRKNKLFEKPNIRLWVRGVKERVNVSGDQFSYPLGQQPKNHSISFVRKCFYLCLQSLFFFVSPSSRLSVTEQNCDQSYYGFEYRKYRTRGFQIEVKIPWWSARVSKSFSSTSGNRGIYPCAEHPTMSYTYMYELLYIIKLNISR